MYAYYVERTCYVPFVSSEFDDDSIILLQGMRYCLYVHVNLIRVRAHIDVQVHLLSD